MSDEYKPVACSFYDQLELLALKKQIIIIDYINESGTHSLPAIIKELVTKEQEEFLVTTSNLEIRLDKITGIDGREPDTYC